ncbi:2-oxo-4-hydroxy-4-carboxy-5-ureidoimidazoline decarboxylase [Cellulomonas fengjieae]|uniref:2-oxo-4-hydroxy-4-carboxy-5-ureidoimidazoline decarboxylase n=1 Tax=Cellulomonas fengjieae TaxID=2819978 RepID=A0ABS3SGP4_9CELL|nr:2-oxo-4-hydroxy-4-carboxy-5-ureidoimidazoline decarboxylase [Cellulomonas fengjieae]MBO3084674.1 2-oxo-4-hydroxy-4-carboxy-5-ureidoimidazoline decarboxylase [Cellulomonas fengjieae]QVI67002.1 2-oxo-4-hydroxy-4-carboxy-5-ureidoimidazoline decarboxylase [Cellulomonas fengjieae]
MIDDGPETRSLLTTALHVRRWVDEVASGCPYPSLDALVGVADLAARPLSTAEVDEALSAHPRIGATTTGLSTAEQSASATDDPALVAAMDAGNRAYEERFGRIFLIRAAGRSRTEILDELHRRLGLSDDDESAEVADQLRQIALLRLRTLFAS